MLDSYVPVSAGWEHRYGSSYSLPCEYQNEACPFSHLSPVMLEQRWVLTPASQSTELRERGLTMAPVTEAEEGNR